MLTQELFSICTFYAISPIHAGSGASTSAVDLPIQRERHTNWPHIQASGVKGAMRDHYRKFAGKKQDQTINLIFGSDRDNDKDQKGFDKDYPGAVSFSDAKILCFPMRSNAAPFVWVTCPTVLQRFKNDLDFAGFDSFGGIPPLEGENALNLSGTFPEKLIIEDAIVKVINMDIAFEFPKGFPKIDRLVLISDEMFDYCVTCCTEIQTQIKIDSETGTAAPGALRYQELMPSDTLMYSVVYFSRTAELNALQANTIQSHIEETIKDFIQIGGDETLGRGICRISWVKNEKTMRGAE